MFPRVVAAALCSLLLWREMPKALAGA